MIYLIAGIWLSSSLCSYLYVRHYARRAGVEDIMDWRSSMFEFLVGGPMALLAIYDIRRTARVMQERRLSLVATKSSEA